MIVRRLGKLWERMRGTVRNEPRDLEFQAEMEEHVRLLAERYRRQGMTAGSRHAGGAAAVRQHHSVAGGPEGHADDTRHRGRCEAI